MRTRITSLFVGALLGLLLLTLAWADLLYDNGPINGTIEAWLISAGIPYYQVSDSFTLGSSSNLTEAQIGLWVVRGDTPLTVDWSIGTDKFLSDIGFGLGTALTTSSMTPTVGGIDLYESTFSLSGMLPAGTYWLTLKNAVTTYSSLQVRWDENKGPSQAWSNIVGDLSLYQPTPTTYGGSESFQIYGTTAAVPEPSTMLLLGSGLLGLVGLRRRLKK